MRLAQKTDDMSSIARAGKFLSRIILFMVLMGVLLNAAAEYAMPMPLVVVLGVVVVGPLLYWPTLGIVVCCAYLAIEWLAPWGGGS